MNNENHFDVVIIGAGVNGLYLGKLLRESKKKVLILESSDVIGGRIQQIEKHGRKYDLGAEFIHGGNTILKKIVDENKWPYERVFQDIREINKEAQMYAYLPQENKFEYLEKLKNEDRDFQKLFELLSFEKEIKDNKMNVLQYLINNGATYRTLDFCNSLYAQTQGTSLDKLNAKGAQDEFNEAEADSNNYRLFNSFEPMIKHFAKDLNIRKNSKVNAIDYSQNKVLIDYKNEKNLSSRVTSEKVVVTIPISVLKTGQLSFNPSLPQLHTKAIKDLGMDGGTKVIIWFKKSFWPQDFSICICSNSIFAQFWKERKYEGQNVECLTGFITGERSNRLENLSHNDLINSALKFYDTVFGSQGNTSPASQNFVDGLVYHWGSNEHVRGSYTYQTSHDSSLLRKLSSHPVNDRLYFSGEAFSVNSATVEGALDSATVTHNLILNPKHHSKL